MRYVRGKPFTKWIPDPDLVQWEDQQDRAGYHYRGMRPSQKRFYDHIQAKRRDGIELSWADRKMIGALQAVRRWPHAPVPTNVGMAFLKYMRNLDRKELNFTENMVFNSMVAAGLVPVDFTPTTGQNRKMVDYLRSESFEPNNWFERNIYHAGPALADFAARRGYDLSPGPGKGALAGGSVFPDKPFNTLQLTYSISGVTLGEATDHPDFTTSRTYDKGAITGKTITLSGSASGYRCAFNTDYGSFYTVLDVKLRVRAEVAEHHESAADKVGGRKDRFSMVFKPEPFKLSVTLPPDEPHPEGSFSITYTLVNPRFGNRVLVVSGTFAGRNEEAIAAADAKWRAEVERTLAAMGVEDTPAGRAVKEMRDALAGGDEAWDQYTRRQAEKLGLDTTPESKQFEELKQAMQADDDVWDEYVRKQGGADEPATQADKELPDVGGLRVGPRTVSGKTQAARDHFYQTSQVVCALDYKDLPADTTVEAVWTRDGEEIARSQRQTGGTGWVSFSINTSDAGGLAAGRYTVTVTAGDKVIGRKSFTIGL